MSSKTTDIDVRYVAQLARIQLTKKEIETFGGQLGDVLNYVKQLDELDLEGVEPSSHTEALSNVFREDRPKKGLERGIVLENAPAEEDNQLRVPPIIDS